MAMLHDFIIIGAGSAGCVLAHRLSENPKNRVLLLEAGGRNQGRHIRIPAGFVKTLHDAQVNWCFKTEPSEATENRPIHFPRGKGVGGSSAINGHLHVRGQARDFDMWGQLGNVGWSYEDVLPYFKRAETRVGGDAQYRGNDGPLHVEDVREQHALCDAFLDSAAAVGILRNPDYNAARQEGSGYYQQTIHNGRRWSAADAYLIPAQARKNLTVITEAFVEKIDLVEGRAVAVIYRHKGESRKARCAREIILSAGTIQSPHLLQLSGIGDGDHLRNVGLELVHHLPGVGRNLRDHYLARIAYRVTAGGSINERAYGLRFWAEIFKYFTRKRGILALSPAHVGAFARTRPELETPDVQFVFAPASFEGIHTGVLEKEPGMTLGVWQLRSESQGTVLAKTMAADTPPAIQPNYLDLEIDRETLVAGLKLGRQIMQAGPLAPYRGLEIQPGDQITSDAEWLDYARRTGNTVYHPVGTCKMGNDLLAVVDDHLRVLGLRGLRVVDASVMPTMISGNTNAATIMIAERAADLMLADLQTTLAAAA